LILPAWSDELLSVSAAPLAAHLVEPGIKGEDVCVRGGGGEGGEGEVDEHLRGRGRRGG